MPHLLCPVERDFLHDYTGLRVPARFDCNNFNAGQPWSGGHDYYNAVPDRWVQCNRHEANLKSYLQWYVPSLPVIDEEYDEHVTLAREVSAAAQRCQSDFVLFEAGARWGTWGFRGAALASLITAGHMRARVTFWEPEPQSVEGIWEAARANNFSDVRVFAAPFSAAEFRGAVRDVGHVDYFDVDIQGAEDVLCADRELLAVVAQKVRLLKVGTHSRALHRRVLGCLRKVPGFAVVAHERFGAHELRVMSLFRVRRTWDYIRKKGLFNASPRGPVVNWDGTVVVRNDNVLPQSFCEAAGAL